MSQVVLSIVVPTYNRLPELQTMLESLLGQVAGLPVEVLIADHKLTDGTWERLQTSFHNHAQVRLFRMEQNGGPGPARNLCLEAARGRFFIPIDSDFIVSDGAIRNVLEGIRTNEESYSLLFFPCLQYPAMRRLDNLQGQCEIHYEPFVTDQVGEVVAVASIAWMRSRGLAYPALRAGGETLLWAEYLADGPALFIDVPIVLYRTDVSQRICTLEYQMSHPVDLAVIADAMVSLLTRRSSAGLRSARARKCMAAGTYHLLAGNSRIGRRRLISAAAMGCWPAALPLALSFGGSQLFRTLFRLYRTRLAKAYL